MAEQQGGQFLANTPTNPKEQCKDITDQCGKQVGSDVITKAANNRKKIVENVVECRQIRG